MCVSGGRGCGHQCRQARQSLRECRRAETQKGTGIAASPHVTGLRLLIPKDRAAWFRRHAPLAPARACERRVGHRGRSAYFRGKGLIFRPVARFMTSPEGGAMEPCWTRFPERSIGFGFRLRGTLGLRLLSSGRSFRRSAACAGLSAWSRPSGSPFAFDLRLRVDLGIRFRPASASSGLAATLAHRLDPETADALASSSLSSVVARGHLRSIDPCK